MISKHLLLILLCTLASSALSQEIVLPVAYANRQDISNISLTDIGAFGELRKERPGIPAHFHTGIDIIRPATNYHNEPIYPVYKGIVISKRTDGPYAMLIIEHDYDPKFWTVYEHIAGITVELFQEVNPDMAIARFMNGDELDQYGWQFDHLHFEILKNQPVEMNPDASIPERLFKSYTLNCHSKEDLNACFYNPMQFLKDHLFPYP